MAEEVQGAPQPRRADDHAGASANPEQHLLESHNLSIKLQGKEGTWGKGKWALVKEEKGKTKTLTVYEGTKREAAHHFFDFIHPNRPVAPVPASRGGGERRGSGGGDRRGGTGGFRGQGGGQGRR